MNIKLSNILFESKQGIIYMGYPEIVAGLLYSKFGNLAPLMARWFRDWHTGGQSDEKDWWRLRMRGLSSRELGDYAYLHASAKAGVDEYNKAKDYYDEKKLSPEEFSLQQQELVERFKKASEITFNNDLFFDRKIIKDILSGKLRDLAPYKDLGFQEANRKYEEEWIFSKAKAIKEYPNGWKWIDTGKKCDFIGHTMRNCGSTGVMSLDSDKTMVVLFDENNKPHVITTYSPNQQRLSGEEGGASTTVKNEYVDYVIDLAKTLGARFDADKSKSKLAKLKWWFRSVAKSIEPLSVTTDLYASEFFLVKTNDKKAWVTDTYRFMSLQDFKTIKLKNANTTAKKLSKVFRHDSQDEVRALFPNVVYIKLHEFLKMYGIEYSE